MLCYALHRLSHKAFFSFLKKADCLTHGSGKLTGGAPGLQIRCGALKPSRVGSIPMHFRQHFFSYKLVSLFINLKILLQNYYKYNLG